MKMSLVIPFSRFHFDVLEHQLRRKRILTPVEEDSTALARTTKASRLRRNGCTGSPDIREGADAASGNGVHFSRGQVS